MHKREIQFTNINEFNKAIHDLWLADEGIMICDGSTITIHPTRVGEFPAAGPRTPREDIHVVVDPLTDLESFVDGDKLITDFGSLMIRTDINISPNTAILDNV